MLDDIIITEKDADLYLTYKLNTDADVDLGKLNLLPITKKTEINYHPQLIPIQFFLSK